jgi:hypothetical protein
MVKAALENAKPAVAAMGVGPNAQGGLADRALSFRSRKAAVPPSGGAAKAAVRNPQPQIQNMDWGLAGLARAPE